MSAYDLIALVLVACLVAGYPLHRRAVAQRDEARARLHPSGRRLGGAR